VKQPSKVLGVEIVGGVARDNHCLGWCVAAGGVVPTCQARTRG